MKRLLTAMIAVLLLIVLCVPFAHAEKTADSGTYYIEVDITNQIVTIYRRSDMVVVRKMICSTGKASTPTPTGTYYLPAKSRVTERQKWYTMADCYVQYATRIRGGYMFHSYLFSAMRDSAVIQSSVSALGSQASHGCVRLRIADAKFIAKNCPAGTKTYIYKSGKRNEEIRKLLKKSTYSIDCGKSWEEWAGLGNDVNLGRGDRGAKVKQLQERLVGMGYGNIENDGIYGQDTLDAVKRFQKATGRDNNGVTDPDTWDALFSDDAPAGTKKVTLFEGTNGKKVEELQDTLTKLLYYNGKITGVFDAETKKAVDAYHEDYEESKNGRFTYEQQHTAQKLANKLIEKYGEGNYRLEYEKYSIPKCKVTKKHIYLRKKGSSSSKQLAKLKKGTVLDVIEKADKWSRVSYNGKKGYIQTKYANFYPEEHKRPYYLGPDETPRPTPTPEATPTPKPTNTPAPTDTPEPTYTPTPEPTETPTPEPTETPTPEPTETPEPTNSPEP